MEKAREDRVLRRRNVEGWRDGGRERLRRERGREKERKKGEGGRDRERGGNGK